MFHQEYDTPLNPGTARLFIQGTFWLFSQGQGDYQVKEQGHYLVKEQSDYLVKEHVAISHVSGTIHTVCMQTLILSPPFQKKDVPHDLLDDVLLAAAGSSGSQSCPRLLQHHHIILVIIICPINHVDGGGWGTGMGEETGTDAALYQASQWKAHKFATLALYVGGRGGGGGGMLGILPFDPRIPILPRFFSC